MKIRAPRKAKKQAKRLKAVHDAFVMTQAAVSTAMVAIQIARIVSMPNPTLIPGWPALKSLKVAECAMNQADSVKNILSQIKPWQHFVRPKMKHL